MEPEKILSICIPTFNRAKALDRLLGNMAQEMGGIDSGIEICVSDNGSSDDTGKVLDRWESRLPIVRRKNEKNLGYDRNALEVTKMGSGRFLWHVGDDDLFVEGTVKRLLADLSGLKGKGVGAVYVNACLRDKWVGRFGFDDFRVFSNEGIPAPLNVSFGGSICLNRDIARKVIDDNITVVEGKLHKKNFGTVAFNDFVHAYLFMECLERSGKIGIEPRHGIRILADGNRITYRKKLYLEFIIVKYVLEMKERYPWFREAGLIVNSKLRVMGRTFINSGFALDDPKLEYLFQAYLGVVMRILELEKRGFELAALRTFSAFRKAPVLRQLIWLCFAVVKNAARMPFDNKPDDSKVLASNERYALGTLQEILKKEKTGAE